MSHDHDLVNVTLLTQGDQRFEDAPDRAASLRAGRQTDTVLARCAASRGAGKSACAKVLLRCQAPARSDMGPEDDSPIGLSAYRPDRIAGRERERPLAGVLSARMSITMQVAASRLEAEGTRT